jgi:hypothetical protein
MLTTRTTPKVTTHDDVARLRPRNGGMIFVLRRLAATSSVLLYPPNPAVRLSDEAPLARHPIDVTNRLVLVAWHEVAVEIEGRVDRRMAEVSGDGLCVDAGRDQETRKSVAAFVEADWIETSSAPRRQCALAHRGRCERPRSVRPAGSGSP